jgi:hypothetical protein
VARAMRRERVAFLFLGETLLIPHLWPIVEALAGLRPDLPIDLWVSTSVHEALLGTWKEGLGPQVRLRRAPSFRTVARAGGGRNPPLPAKLPMLFRLAPRLLEARVAVCAEQTSLCLPRLLPFLPIRFVNTDHGAGSVNARDDPRQRAAAIKLVPSEMERAQFLARGFDPARVIATGYLKSAFRQRTSARDLFADDRPTLLYTPHWQRHRSSWWAWGREIVAMLCAQRKWNVILAPHQRLAEKDPELGRILADAARHDHVHGDLDGFAMVDGSYTAAADLYLGDTSSQVVEFLGQPRPCIFLNNDRVDWRAAPDRGFWACGEVVDELDRLPGALEEAAALYPSFRPVQERFAAAALGDTSGQAPIRAARAILAVLGE